jgi:RIO kinase 2
MLYTARIAAEREYDILEELYPDVRVPRPIDHNRHAIIMEKMSGVELSRASLPETQVVGVLDLILGEVAKAYEAGYVHADMSEYNVFVSDDGITIFDWPQAVSTEHDNATELLTRDITNLLGYFRRKYPRFVSPDADSREVAQAVMDGAFETVADFQADTTTGG